MKKYSKKLLLAMLGMTIVLTAAGCQSTKSTANLESQSANETDTKVAETKLEETKTEEANGTRTVQTVMGDVEVPSDPQRVVVNWYIGDALALDLNVVGYNAWAHEAMPFYDKMKASNEIKNWEQEDVMALDPDLIITYSKDDYDTFKSIAPVIVVTEDEMDSVERILFLGESTGHSEKAKSLVEVFESKLADGKKALQEDRFKDKTFSINEDWGSASYGVYYETGSRGGTIVYDYLGMKKPEKLEQLIKESGETRGGLSYEVAANYFGDYMLWFRPYDSVEDVPSEYETSSIWNSLPAVQAKHVVTIPGKMSGLFYYDDVLSLTSQLDYIVAAIVSTEK